MRINLQKDMATKTNIINVLSFDCGFDPLAACILSFDLNYKKKLDMLTKIFSSKKKNIEFIIKWLDEIDFAASNTVILRKIFSVNLLKNDKLKDISDLFKIFRIKVQLGEIDKYIKQHNINIDVVLCENQQIPNNHIQSIKSIIVYHYTPIEGNVPKVIIVNPRIKNKICLSPSLNHKIFIEKYSTRYLANKHHCAANMLFWIKSFGLEHLLEEALDIIPKSKKKKYYRDIGDAFCQAIAFYSTGELEKII